MLARIAAAALMLLSIGDGAAATRALLSREDLSPVAGKLPRSAGLRSAPEGWHMVFVHIPKSAGASFQRDVGGWIPEGTSVKGNMEHTLAHSRKRHPKRPAMVFLRHPWKHVLSQFMECKYAPWGKRTTARHAEAWRAVVRGKNEKDETNGSDQGAGTYDGFHAWVRHFLDSEPGDAGLDSFAFGCYNPWNMQARYLGTTAHRPHIDEDQRRPPLGAAMAGIRELFFVGTADLYKESLCLVRFLTTGGLPEECSCGATGLEQKMSHSQHGVPQHSLEDLPLHVLRDVGRLTSVDAALYLEAMPQFEAVAKRAAHVTGVNVLCEGQVEKLLAEVRALQALSGDPLAKPDAAVG